MLIIADLTSAPIGDEYPATWLEHARHVSQKLRSCSLIGEIVEHQATHDQVCGLTP